MKISIEKRKSDKSGRQALRLVYYFGLAVDKDTHKKTRKRKHEPLDLYLFHDPRTPRQRNHNKETLRLAEAIKASMAF